MSDGATLGFRIRGSCTGERKCIDWHRAFNAYCAADVPGGVDGEAFLSAFAFPPDFGDYLRTEGTTKGYDGPCGGSWLWIDLDGDPAKGGVDAALKDARALCLSIADRFALSEGALLAIFSVW